LPSIEERVHKIEQDYAPFVQELLVLSLTDETLKLVFTLYDKTTLRVMERWQDGVLVRYSYYWLNDQHKLKIGWDNAPHHKQLDNFPHHKHMGEQSERVASYEICLEDVMLFLEKAINKSGEDQVEG
jgi:hypothetical protein